MAVSLSVAAIAKDFHLDLGENLQGISIVMEP
jgi:hypothetical protein